MKTASDPRHLNRIKLFKRLFSLGFNLPPHRSLVPIHAQLPKIDRLIVNHAPDWPIDKLNKVDLAILRLAIFELKFTPTPKKVVIDEAVELGKTYGSAKTSKFVNGVLAALINDSTQ